MSVNHEAIELLLDVFLSVKAAYARDYPGISFHCFANAGGACVSAAQEVKTFEQIRKGTAHFQVTVFPGDCNLKNAESVVKVAIAAFREAGGRLRRMLSVNHNRPLRRGLRRKKRVLK
jgi:hypothetical protein